MVSSLSQTCDLRCEGSLRVVRGGAWGLRTSVMSSKGPLRAIRRDPPLWLLELVGKLNGLRSNATHTIVVMQILVGRRAFPSADVEPAEVPSLWLAKCGACARAPPRFHGAFQGMYLGSSEARNRRRVTRKIFPRDKRRFRCGGRARVWRILFWKIMLMTKRMASNVYTSPALSFELLAKCSVSCIFISKYLSHHD